MAQVPSPCTGVCRIAALTLQCLGCKRTLEEIADWPILSAKQKRALLEQLQRRD